MKFGVYIQHVGNAYSEQNVWVRLPVKKPQKDASPVISSSEEKKTSESGSDSQSEVSETDSQTAAIPKAPIMKRYRVDGIYLEEKRMDKLTLSMESMATDDVNEQINLFQDYYTPDTEKPSMLKKKTILEYMQCGFNHGWCDLHETGKDLDEVISILGKSSRKLKEETFQRFDLLSKSYNIKFTWSCWWNTLRCTDPEIVQFVNHFSYGPEIRQRSMTEAEMLSAIADQEVEGVCKISATVPPESRKYFAIFPPIFKHGRIGARQLEGTPMKVYAEKQNMNIAQKTKSKSGQNMLLSVYSGKSLVLSTDYIRWLMEHKVKFFNLQVIIQFQTSCCFQDFIREMTERRRQADRTGNKLLENQTKILVNSAYGGCIKSIHKYSNTKIVTEKQMVRAMHGSGFDSFYPIGPLAIQTQSKVVTDNKVLAEEKESPTGEAGLYEICVAPRTLKYKQPFQLGFQILSWAKIELLRFYYDFLVYYLRPESFDAISTDTDSMYFGIATETLRESVKPEKLLEFDEKWTDWLVNDKDVWTKRQPGLWKLEARGTHMVALSSKLYHLEDERLGKRKIAHKGIQRTPNDQWLNRSTFIDVLFHPYQKKEKRHYCRGSDEEGFPLTDTDEKTDTTLGTVEVPHVLNRGIAQKYGNMVTYEMRKNAMNSFYAKYKVKSCLSHVQPYEDNELSDESSANELGLSDAEIMSMSDHDPFD